MKYIICILLAGFALRAQTPRDAEIRATTVTLHQNGRDQVAKRVD